MLTVFIQIWHKHFVCKLNSLVWGPFWLLVFFTNWTKVEKLSTAYSYALFKKLSTTVAANYMPTAKNVHTAQLEQSDTKKTIFTCWIEIHACIIQLCIELRIYLYRFQILLIQRTREFLFAVTFCRVLRIHICFSKFLIELSDFFWLAHMHRINA